MSTGEHSRPDRADQAHVDPGTASVAAVVVTWNRRALLEESLDALAAQTSALAVVVVVDNASDDGTAAYLGSRARQDPLLDVVRLSVNTGGAGGFAAGIGRALTHDPELVWLLDDDTVPTPRALEELLRVRRSYRGPRPGTPAVLASRVVWTDGRDHPMNTPRPKPGARRAELAAAAAVGAVPIRSASFVSMLAETDAVARRGLPIVDYFLWNDDFEYSTRLLRGRTGLYVPASVVVHKTRTFGSTDADPGERFFYEVRNKLWLFTRSRGLAPAEKVVYAASTARRWARTVRGSQDRRTLLRAAGRGLRAASAGPPRTNEEVLEPAGLEPASGRVLPPGTPFALLISTWAGDRPDYLALAFESSVQLQTRPPAQVVLVQDGPVPPELSEQVARLAEASPVPVTHVVLEANQGLGPALDAGLAASEHEVVARMDADDWSEPERFERQLPLIEAGADIVGSGLWEFRRDPRDSHDLVGRRTPPVDPAEIRRVISFRDPFNHPTVVYRRSAVQAAGGYTDMALMEDYLLFTRMVRAGAVPANLPDPLVRYRIGDGAYARRGGTDLLRSELALQRRLLDLGLVTRRQYARNVVVRGGYRLVPEPVRRRAYRRLLANRTGPA